jgi:hypothetical protein
MAHSLSPWDLAPEVDQTHVLSWQASVDQREVRVSVPAIQTRFTLSFVRAFGDDAGMYDPISRNVFSSECTATRQQEAKVTTTAPSES